MGTHGLVGAVVVVVVLLAGSVFGLRRRRTDGTLITVDRPDAQALAGLGFDGAAAVTLVQFSTAFCAPCRTLRAWCATLAAGTTGVRHLDVDAESHLDAVRALGVTRTPTLLVVDAAGRIVRRCAGLPTRDQLTSAVAEVLAARL